MRIREDLFNGIPGVLWTPDDDATHPLIFLGHGGGQHKKHPAIVHRAERFVAAGFAVIAVDVPNHGDRARDERLHGLATEIQARVADGGDLARLLLDFQTLVAEQTVPEWRGVLDTINPAGPVGYWGVSLGCGLGVPFVAAEPRIRAAVLGLGGGGDDIAARITVPVEFVIQWDDERIPRERSLALFDALGSAEKTLHANPGKHADRLPDYELDGQVAFFTRHLTGRSPGWTAG